MVLGVDRKWQRHEGAVGAGARELLAHRPFAAEHASDGELLRLVVLPRVQRQSDQRARLEPSSYQ